MCMKKIKELTAAAAVFVMVLTNIFTVTAYADDDVADISVNVKRDGDSIILSWENVDGATVYPIDYGYGGNNGVKGYPGDTSVSIPIDKIKKNSDGTFFIAIYAYDGGSNTQLGYKMLTFNSLDEITVSKPAVSDENASDKQPVILDEQNKKENNVKAAAPTNFKAKKTSNSVTLSWDAADGADKYIIYKYNPETKKYEKYKIVKNPNVKITKLKPDTKYKFKVVSYNKNEDGKYIKGETSKPISVTTKK